MADRFSRAYKRYLQDHAAAREARASHDQLRHLFTSFLAAAYPQLSSAEIQLERHISALEVRGFIDLLYRNLVFEFKRDLKAEREVGLEELERYLKSQKEPGRAFGLLTDGRSFEIFSLRDSGLESLDCFELTEASEESARLALDCYLFAERSVAPTAEDIVRRFGERSPVFAAANAVLRRCFVDLRSKPPTETKFGEWNSLLSHVYGSEVGDDDLFLRHTYLVVLTRLLAYTALRGRVPEDRDLPGIMDGGAFEPFGIQNLVEGDFFAWVLEEQISAQTKHLLRGVATHLSVYDFKALNEDVLKELYQHLVDPATRHDLGEYYTPDWLAERALIAAEFGPGKSLLDPACGSGTFLFTAIRMLRHMGVTGEDLVRFAFENLAGLDVHPVAIMIAKVNFVLALLNDLKGRKIRGLPQLPIYMADSLAIPLRPHHLGISVGVHAPGWPEKRNKAIPETFTIPVESQDVV